jgi:hypothetical protein
MFTRRRFTLTHLKTVALPTKLFIKALTATKSTGLGKHNAGTAARGTQCGSDVSQQVALLSRASHTAARLAHLSLRILVSVVPLPPWFASPLCPPHSRRRSSFLPGFLHGFIPSFPPSFLPSIRPPLRSSFLPHSRPTLLSSYRPPSSHQHTSDQLFLRLKCSQRHIRKSSDRGPIL